MRIQKPDWNAEQLNADYQRWQNLIDETESHELDCRCNRCLEEYALGELLGAFSEAEHAAAVIELNRLAGE